MKYTMINAETGLINIDGIYFYMGSILTIEKIKTDTPAYYYIHITFKYSDRIIKIYYENDHETRDSELSNLIEIWNDYYTI